MEHFHFHSKVHLSHFHVFRHKSHDLFPREFPSRRWYKCHGFLLWLLGKWRVAWGEREGSGHYSTHRLDVSQSHVNNGAKYQPQLVSWSRNRWDELGIGGMSWVPEANSKVCLWKSGQALGFCGFPPEFMDGCKTSFISLTGGLARPIFRGECC